MITVMVFVACLAARCETFEITTTPGRCQIWGQIDAVAHLQARGLDGWTLKRGWKCLPGRRA